MTEETMVGHTYEQAVEMLRLFGYTPSGARQPRIQIWSRDDGHGVRAIGLITDPADSRYQHYIDRVYARLGPAAVEEVGEVAHALTYDGEADLRGELVDVLAVSSAWINSLDRRAAAHGR